MKTTFFTIFTGLSSVESQTALENSRGGLYCIKRIC